MLRLECKVLADARVSDVKVIDRVYRAGEMRSLRAELKIDRERLRQAAESHQVRRVRVRRDREAARAGRATRFRLRKKRRRVF